jgi:tetratricopeptide (TPR) repeat protein
MLRLLESLHRSLAVIAALVAAPPAASSQQPRLLDRPPFDRVILNEANDNALLDVKPLDLPQRPLTTLPTEGKLTLQLLDRPLESFEVDWADVARVLIHEQILLEEARRLATAGEFDNAYDYFARLSTDYPEMPGLDEARGDYLRRNAFALYQARQNDRALAVLLTLYQQNPKFPGLPAAVETVAGEIIQRYLREQDFAAARAVLELWKTQFQGLATSAADLWQSRFESAAEKKLGEARQLFQEKKYIPARKAAEGALAIWPASPANELLAAIQRDFPSVTVAVLEASPRRAERRIDNWASLRANRLVEPLLAEQVGFGAEGGIYDSPFGVWESDETGLALTLKPHPPAGEFASRLARHVLRLVDADHDRYRSDLANLLEGVSITDKAELRLHWLRPHVRPEALLQFPPPPFDDSSASAARARFVEADRSLAQVVFSAVEGQDSRPSPGPRAIVEQTMPGDVEAVAALLAGEVDVLDRVPPWRVQQLSAAPGIRVGSYRLPTVHVLIPNLSRPLLAKREFRRALCFGIDRKWIVERVLLAGAKLPGFEVLSGPFPAGVSLSDPIRYAYNNQLAPRAFEPRLAAILAGVGWANVHRAAQKSDSDGEEKEDKPASDADIELDDLPELVLAHPADPLVRIACQSIQLQLQREGIRVKLSEFTADELVAGKVDCDLRYAELAVWEPVVDARLVMGPGGLADIGSPYLNAALRRLDDANNWKDVRSRLAEIHEIAHHELPVIPLWQTTNFFAYRSRLTGVGQSPVTLYQDVESWAMSFDDNVAQARAAD